MSNLEELKEKKRKLLAKQSLKEFGYQTSREKKQLKKDISKLKHPKLVRFATGVKKGVSKTKELNKKRLEEKRRKWNSLTKPQKEAILKRRRDNEKFFLGK